MGGFFVPHDLKAPLKGAATGPLAGLTAAVKDLYAIAGEKTGGGNPDWLAHAQTATKHAAAVEKILADIEESGDKAVRELSKKFDDWSPKSFKLSAKEIEKAIAARDHLDSTRSDSPLTEASGSITVDTTGLTIDEVLARIVVLLRQ